MRRFLPYLVFAIIATQLPAQQAGAVAKAAAAITETDVARHIFTIADDSMMGRDTPSRGLELTAKYVADQFQKFGLKPAGDNGTWFQRYSLPNDNEATAPNTVGILEGSDAKLKNEYIVVSAHMDHLGISSGATDSINNGADDNASGTAGVIELAKAFSQTGVRPQRSVIFLIVSGEEKGLWGSEYFVDHSIVPIGQVVANVNLDGLGYRVWRDSVAAIGGNHSDMGATLKRVNAAHPELSITAVRNPWEFSLSISDQYMFILKGIPSIWFCTGPSDYLHTPADSPDKVDAEKEVRILRLFFYFVQELANAAQRPIWNPVSYQRIVVEHEVIDEPR